MLLSDFISEWGKRLTASESRLDIETRKFGEDMPASSHDASLLVDPVQIPLITEEVGEIYDKEKWLFRH